MTSFLVDQQEGAGGERRGAVLEGNSLRVLEAPGGVRVAAAASAARTPRTPAVRVTPGPAERGVVASDAA